MKKPDRWWGQWTPQVDQVIWENFFQNADTGTILECGSANGLTESNTKAFETIGWTCIQIEPEPHRFKQLCENRTTPNNINLNYVLSDTNDEEITFEVGPTPGNFCKGKTRTFRSLFDNELKDIKHLDVFVLDVEGHEPRVIDGMVASRILPDIICVEYTWVDEQILKNKLYNLGYNPQFYSYNNLFFCKKDSQYDLLCRHSNQMIGETRHWRELGM